MDASIYNRQTANPLTRLGEMADVVNRLNQNQLFPGTMAIQAQNVRRSESEADTAEIAEASASKKLQLEQFQAMNNLLAGLAVKKDLSKSDFAGMGRKLVNMGIVGPDIFAEELKSVPDHPEGVRDHVKGMLIDSLDAQQRLQAVLGTPQMVDTGAGAVPITMSPVTGMRRMDGIVPRELSPSELAQPTEIGVDPSGRTITGTRRQFLERAGDAPQAAPPGAAGVVAPGAVQGVQSAVSRPGADVGAVASGGVVTKPTPGQVSSMEAASKQYSEAQSYVVGSPDSPGGSASRLFALQQGLEGLKGAGTTGPGSDTLNQIQSYILMLGAGELVGIDPERVADFDKANKYLTAYAQQTAGAMGSDNRLASALSANASTQISNLAAQDVVKANIALERMLMARVTLFDLVGKDPAEFSSWSAKYNKNVDPAAFAVDVMTPEARAVMWSKMSSTQRQKFKDSLEVAIQTQVIDPAFLGAQNAR